MEVDRIHQVCTKCIMSTNDDPYILFNGEGVCNYCNSYLDFIKSDSYKQTHQQNEILRILDKIKIENKDNKYDCIVGISGGTDSAYLVYKMVELGLRPLAIHYDNGWNSEAATKNIEMLLKALNVDLYTYVNDWEEFKDLQLSFFKAGVIDIEILTDQAIVALLYKMSIKYKTKYIFTGHNTSTEFVLPKHWYHWKLDALNIKSIHKKWGTKKIKTYPLISFLEQYYHGKYRKTKMIPMLDYLNYDKNEAQQTLSEKFNWKNYGAKHNESIFTRFYQNYILPVKFKVDKRNAHLSSLICSGQISREQALEEIKVDTITSKQTIEDKFYVLKKLDITETVFDVWMKQKAVSHFEYPSYITRHDKIIKKLKKMLGK